MGDGNVWRRMHRVCMCMCGGGGTMKGGVRICVHQVCACMWIFYPVHPPPLHARFM